MAKPRRYCVTLVCMRGTKGRSVQQRVLDMIRHEGDCWIWDGALGRGVNKEYGVMQVAGKAEAAHRMSYEAFVGAIPPGLVIDHLCGNPPCVNPDHLEPVTQQENALRALTSLAARNAAKTTCPRGHAYDMIRPADGARMCRTCERARTRESLRRMRARRKAERQAAHA